MQRLMCVLTILALCACVARADWEEPKDNKLTEKRKNIPAENIALLKKHSKVFKQALGIEEEKKDR